MALESVSHFFDKYRQRGKVGEQILQSVKQSISGSFTKSSLGDYSKYLEVPDDEFDNWLNLLTAQEEMDPFTEEQKREIKRQFSTCLVGAGEKN